MGRLIWPALLTVVAVIAVAVASAGRDTHADLEYLEAVRRQAGELSKDGDALRVVTSHLSRVERNELQLAIDGIRDDIDEGMTLVEDGAPSEALIGINSLYRQALESWTVGISGFESGILTAADDPSNTIVVDNLANAMAEMRTGDRVYVDLVRELAADDIPDPVGAMPNVVLMPADGELLVLSQAYVAASRSINSKIALRPGLGVSEISSDPLWNVNPDDETVVPATEAITFAVVVSNKGNVESEPGSLRLTLSGVGDPVVIDQTVGVLAPGQQTAIMFEDMAVESGGLYEVKASLETIQLDTDFDDNELSVIFMVNASQDG
jgi:hypothetical protein